MSNGGTSLFSGIKAIDGQQASLGVGTHFSSCFLSGRRQIRAYFKAFRSSRHDNSWQGRWKGPINQKEQLQSDSRRKISLLKNPKQKQ